MEITSVVREEDLMSQKELEAWYRLLGEDPLELIQHNMAKPLVERESSKSGPDDGDMLD